VHACGSACAVRPLAHSHESVWHWLVDEYHHQESPSAAAREVGQRLSGGGECGLCGNATGDSLLGLEASLTAELRAELAARMAASIEAASGEGL
jgi:hypothetical protein